MESHTRESKHWVLVGVVVHPTVDQGLVVGHSPVQENLQSVGGSTEGIQRQSWVVLPVVVVVGLNNL